MYHYNFTNDLRTSNLDISIKEAANCIFTNTVPSALVDKSKNNNIMTLKFYFNLNENSVCTKYAINGYVRNVVLNTIKKFQFPNNRTSTDLQNYKQNNQMLAPMREIVKLLFLLTNFTSEDAYLTSEEIRYFIFYNEDIAKRKNYDLLNLVQQIMKYRRDKVLTPSIENVSINTYWKQEERQLREMLKLLIWSDYVTEENGKYKINKTDLSQRDKADIFEITNYNEFWDPNSEIGYNSYMDMAEEEQINEEIKKNSNTLLNEPLQQIFYGAPGTGKSYKVNEVSKKCDAIRTTFHPDSDYSTFVGAYKPIIEPRSRYGLNQKETVRLKDEEGKPLTEEVITYKFVPQAFTKAYLKAWKLMAGARVNGETPKPFYLVIEEINRGNCAQIFGDLFQLLDRGREGFSSYEIVPDSDIQKFLKEDNELGFGEGLLVSDVVNDDGETIATSEEIRNGEKLVLPCNLHIWATMNTSDQSLFPIDSAFKRRWEWKYIKISDAGKDWKIDINGEFYVWWNFIEQINKVISNMTSSADKQLGYFFCKAGKKVNETDAEPTIITAETFVGKVLFYLWNDVFKDYGFDNSELFKYNKIYDGKSVVSDLTFPDFYNDNNEVDVDTVKQFIDNILKWNSDENK